MTIHSINDQMNLNSLSDQRQSRVSSGENLQNVDQIKKLSEEFEAIFLEIVLKSMRDSVQKSDFIDGGNGEEIFRSMLDSEYSKSLASQRSTGLAESIEKHLLGLIENPEQIDKNRIQVGLQKYKDTQL